MRVRGNVTLEADIHAYIVFIIVWSSDNSSWTAPEYVSMDNLLNHNIRIPIKFPAVSSTNTGATLTKLTTTEDGSVSGCVQGMYC